MPPRENTPWARAINAYRRRLLLLPAQACSDKTISKKGMEKLADSLAGAVDSPRRARRPRRNDLQ